MGLDPNTWGPAAWHFIHAVAIMFPIRPTEAQKQKYSTFFNSLSDILPCELCAEQFRKNLIALPPPLDNSKNMFKWSVDIHNRVNKENGKPIITYDQAYIEFKKNMGGKMVRRRLFRRGLKI